MSRTVPNNKPLLQFDDLMNGLEAFGESYQALDVFADDVQEVVEATPVVGLKAIDNEGRKFQLSPPDRARSYELEFFPEHGVLRLSLMLNRSSNPGAGAALGGLAGTALGAAATKKGQGAAAGLLLGLLVGAALGAASESEPVRRVFTMQFNPTARRWEVYDGGLVRWMKEELLPRAAS